MLCLFFINIANFTLLSFSFRHEMNIIRKKSVILASLTSLEYTSVPVATLVSIIALVLSGQPLTPVNAFMLLAFLNMLRIPICFHLAYGFLGIHDAYVFAR